MPVLPTEPRRRVCDAGYYDNYGMNVLAGWLSECLYDPEKKKWLREMAEGIVVLQIRDGVSELSRTTPAVGDERGSLFGRSVEGVTGPPVAMFAAREAVPFFRNDEQLEGLIDLYNAEFGKGFLTTEVFEFDGSASLSWYLAEEEIEALISLARCKEGKLWSAIDNVRQWWREKRESSIPTKAEARSDVRV
jgi:hypothetical protein